MGQLERTLRDGDLIFQHIGGVQGEALQLATQSPWTHVGIAFKEHGAWMVLEAVGPVKRTPLAEWVEQGDGAYAIRRLKEKPLTPADIERLRNAAEPYIGLPYDLRFLWSNNEIYCSELVWKIYNEGLGIALCTPKPMRDYNLGSKQVRAVMHERYGSAPPLDEPMVAPSTLLHCPMLVPVGE